MGCWGLGDIGVIGLIGVIGDIGFLWVIGVIGDIGAAVAQWGKRAVLQPQGCGFDPRSPH